MGNPDYLGMLLCILLSEIYLTFHKYCLIFCYINQEILCIFQLLDYLFTSWKLFLMVLIFETKFFVTLVKYLLTQFGI